MAPSAGRRSDLGDVTVPPHNGRRRKARHKNKQVNKALEEIGKNLDKADMGDI
jgi:hypothetical protein